MTRRFRLARLAAALAIYCTALPSIASAQETAGAPVRVQCNQQQGQMQILVDGKEALVYRFGPNVDLPHYYPVRSPSGKPLTVQQTEPYPHHRSFWFADAVQLAGQRKVGFYDALYTQVDRNDPSSPFRDHIRQVELGPCQSAGNQAELTMKLLWEMDFRKTPVLDELRQMRIVALDKGEYFLDLTFTLTASYGDVAFLSDAVHYAWPFVRISPEFSVDHGGRITNSEGGVNQAQTNGKAAHWVDYSNAVDGTTEGLTIFSHAANGYPHQWLTRDYGTFGPRRVDARSGKPFVLEQGQQIRQRVGVLVHSGDATSGRVADRYQQYCDGKL